MDKIKTALNSPLFKAACCVGIGLVLIAEKHPMYGGMLFGIAIREFLLAFKSV
jgi:hypothetical protein